MHVLASPLIPWLDPNTIIHSFGPWALLVVCVLLFAETGLLVGFFFPGDTLLVISGLLSFPTALVFHVHIYVVALLVAVAAAAGGELGWLIGRIVGPRVFQRRESGLFSVENVERTNAFFQRFGPLAIVLARFVPVVRTFAPVAAGVGKMDWRRYTLYNVIGALAWCAGLTYLGYVLNYIPPLRDFVENYIDIILVAAVVVSVVPAGLHYWRTSRKSKRAATSAD